MTRSRWALAVAVLTAAVFARSLGADFIGLDDPAHLTRNPRLSELSWESLRWFFGLGWVHWYPLTWLSFAADRLLWDLRPAGVHAVGVALHALNAVLVFALWRRLLPQRRSRDAAAAFGALLFSLHPLRVESVTWATERSDTLSAAFILGSLLAWLDGRPGRSLLLHGVGLTAKGVGMTTPLVLLLLDGLGVSGRPWPGSREALKRQAPFLALSVAAGFLNKAAQDRFGATWALEKLGVFDRLMIGLWNYAHGVVKTAWPSGLMGLYPMPHPFDPSEPRFLLGGALVLALSALVWRLRRRAPAAAAAWGAYLLVMAPMAGFIKTGPQLMADRYSYLAALGFSGLAAAGLARGLEGRRAAAFAAAALAALGALAAATWTRQGTWLDNDRFWSAMAATDPRHAVARHFLGQERIRQGRLAEAELLLRESLALDPSYGATHNSLGNLLLRAGRPAEAVPHFEAALRLSPGRPEPLRGLEQARAALAPRR
ncbi:MAG: tetratricopeptide repeat protein [Elusimicrobiota bacterium]|nr:tetratricopeptide repeat protein [Elusimicrobiota bacterium]